MCERELETEQRLQHIDPHSPGYNSISFSFSWAAQPEAWEPSLCWHLVLIPTSSLQLIWISCFRGYMIIWRPPTSCERHNFAQSLESQVHLWSPISDRMHLLFTQVHFFFWQLGRVGGQYAPPWLFPRKWSVKKLSRTFKVKQNNPSRAENQPKCLLTLKKAKKIDKLEVLACESKNLCDIKLTKIAFLMFHKNMDQSKSRDFPDHCSLKIS